MRPRITTGPDIAILASQLRELKDRFDYPDLFGRGGSASIAVTGGGGAPTAVVAASDSSDFSKGRADFICTGTADQDTIQEAIVAIGDVGRVLLCEGVYSCDTAGTIFLLAGKTLEGLNHRATVLRYVGGVTADALVEMQGGAWVKNLRIELSGA